MDIRRIDGPMAAWKTEENARSRKSEVPARPRSKDRVELSSDESKARSASGQSVSKLASVSSEIRNDRVEEVREKVESGYYDRPETIEQVAGKMVDNGFVP